MQLSDEVGRCAGHANPCRSDGHCFERGFVFDALAYRGVRTVNVSWWGKVATFGLLFALPLFLAAAAEPPGEAVYRAAAWILGVPSLILSWLSAWGYAHLLREPTPSTLST